MMHNVELIVAFSVAINFMVTLLTNASDIPKETKYILDTENGPKNAKIRKKYRLRRINLNLPQ